MESSRNEVDLPEELIREILLRLPVKALLRFKCVCKEWCALIRSPSFIDGHFNHESNRECLLIEQNCCDKKSSVLFSIYQDFDGRHLRSEASINFLSQMPPTGNEYGDLLGPTNGILCAVRRDLGLGHLVLLNLATRKLKLLPPIIPFPKLYDHLNFGFGFDSFSGNYKVVAFQPKLKKLSRNFFCVYNSCSDSWSQVKVVDSLNGRMPALFDGPGVFLNGVHHWLMDDISICGFDMRTESFHEIPVPDAVRDAMITAYDSSIALLSFDYKNKCLDLWVMGGRDGLSLWTKCFSINKDDIPRPLLNDAYYMMPICVWDKNIDQFLLESYPNTHPTTSPLFLWDISTQKVRQFCWVSLPRWGSPLGSRHRRSQQPLVAQATLSKQSSSSSLRFFLAAEPSDFRLPLRHSYSL